MSGKVAVPLRVFFAISITVLSLLAVANLAVSIMGFVSAAGANGVRIYHHKHDSID
jgi:hypothetical protein